MDLIFYNGDHSIKIGNKDSWEDWHLIPRLKHTISPPQVKIKQVDIPGTHGSLDLTTILTGYPLYSNRTGALEFILAPGFDSWETTISKIMNYIQGKNMKMVLADDPGYYYQGMFYVNALKSDAKSNQITINYDLYPFKYDLLRSDEDWLWDPFNFETGAIQDLNNRVVDGSLEITIEGGTELVAPSVTVDSDMTIVHEYYQDGDIESETYDVETGTSIPGFFIYPGENKLTITGNGTITVVYRGGWL